MTGIQFEALPGPSRPERCSLCYREVTPAESRENDGYSPCCNETLER